jgi:hypothetical protein
LLYKTPSAATEGQIGSSELYKLTQQGGPALSNMSDRGLEVMSILSQYMGASRAGTALMSLNQQFSGGTMWTRNAKELERLGILHDGEWSKGGGGGIVLSPEARKRLGSALSDPLAFVTQQLVPAMQAHGITNQDDQVREIFSLIGRQTGQREIVDILRNSGQIGLEIGRLDSGKGLDDQIKANRKDVEQGLNNVSTAWTNLWLAVAGPNSENEIWVLEKLTNGIDYLRVAIEKTNPKAIEAIAGGVGLLGAALTVGGAAALLGAIGPAGWFIAGMAGIAALNWANINNGVSGFLTIMNTLAGAVAGFAIGGPVGALGGGILGATAGHFMPQGVPTVTQPHWYDPFLNLNRGSFGVNPGSPADKLFDLLTGGKHQESIKDGTREGVKEGLNDALLNKSSYTGGVGLLHPAMFTTGGGSIGTSGMLGSPAHAAALGGVAGIRRLAGGAVGSIASSGNAALTGNAYIKSVRSRFAAELKDPQKRLEFAGMLLSEGNPLQTAESAMNRSDMTRQTLMQALHSGFYGPINKHKLPDFMRQLQNNPKLMARMNAAIDAAIAGSDTIKGFTDQGMVSDKNGAWILNHEHLWGSGHGNLYGDWGGGHGHDASAAWRHHFEEQAGAASPAIPPRGVWANVHVHHVTKVDGRDVAKSVTKHQAKMGQGPAQGTRVPDYQGTRPLSI